MLRLVIEDGEGTTHVVPLIRDEITIGRQEGNTIRLTERNVSRRHARLMRAGTQSSPTVLVEDLDSYNGIKLNGDRIAGKCTMRPADLLQIGDYSLALKTEEVTDADLGSLAAAAAEEPPPPPVDPRLPEEERGRFVVVSSNLAGNEYPLDRREVIVGRTDADENDVVIAHRSISRHHAKIIHRDGTFTIIDLASSNGVKVNGEAFGTATLVNGDIIELGHVKLRFCAPGDDYVFTSADVDDVEVESGPSAWQLVFVALLLVGVAIVAFLIVDRVAHNRQAQQGAVTGQQGKAQPQPKPETPKTPEKAAPDVKPIVARANGLLEAEKWDEARAAFDEALDVAPGHAEARAGRDRAVAEANNKIMYEGLQKAVASKRWQDALSRLGDFPQGSVYAPRVQAQRSDIEQGYADKLLADGEAMIEAGSLPDAEEVQKTLAKEDFAADQARALAAAIEKARAQASVAPQPEEPEPPVTPRPRPPRPQPARPTPSTGDMNFDQLIKRSLSQMVRGDRDAAIVLLKMASQKRPRSHVPYQRLCAIYKAKQQYKSALANCKKWRDLEPNVSYRSAIERNIEQLQELINN